MNFVLSYMKICDKYMTNQSKAENYYGLATPGAYQKVADIPICLVICISLCLPLNYIIIPKFKGVYIL